MAASWTAMFTTGWGLYIKAFMMYVGWWLIPLIVLFLYRARLNKYPIEVVIYEKRGKSIIQTNDRAGRFDEPVACYRLKMSKDSIQIPQYDWVLQCMRRPTNVFEKFVNLLSGTIGSITLFKYSSKQYKPIQVRVGANTKEKFVPMKDKNGQEIWCKIYVNINPKEALTKLDFEVVDWDDINHLTQELRAIQMRRSPVLDWIQKWFPIIAIVLGIMALIIAGYYYKDIVTSASCYRPPEGTQTNPNANQPATAPNIPVISNVVTPGQ